MMGMYFLPEEIRILPLLAFLGAFCATVMILLIGGTSRSGKSTLILAGVAVTALLNAGISLISRLDTDLVSMYNDFAVGGLNGVELRKLTVPALVIFLSIIVLIYYSKDMDAMMLGEGVSKSLGVKVNLVRWSAILAGSASAGMVVSFAGLLGFVGLVVPHIARALVGKSVKGCIVVSAIGGGALGLVGMGIMPDFPAGDYITACAVGITSGLAATGMDQMVKQLRDGGGTNG
jgi:iron complex transport system permease protein